jgi:competence protein ComEA
MPDLSSRLHLVQSRLRACWFAWWYAPTTDADGGAALRPRWDVRGVLAIGAVAVAGITLGWWVWWQARPHLIDVGTTVLAEGSPPPGVPTPVTPPPTPDPMLGPGPPPTPSAPAFLVVDVEGRVRWPGIVLVPAGGRVADALHAAGGARGGVSTRSLNLARPVVDGEQIVLDPDHPAPIPTLPSDPTSPGTPAGTSTTAQRPAVPRPPAGPVPPTADHPLNLNTATSAELQTLPGVGPVLASRILAWRSAHQKFSTVEELQEVSGIGPARYAALRRLVRV